MLPETYSLGTTVGNVFTYVKQFADRAISVFSVSGRTPNTSREASIKHELASSGQLRSVVDTTDRNVPVAETGKVETSRVYTVFQKAPNQSTADMKLLVERHYSLIQAAGFQDKLFNQEV